MAINRETEYFVSRVFKVWYFRNASSLDPIRSYPRHMAGGVLSQLDL